MTTPQFHAIIIGAGIAGLSTAYWLGNAGWRTTILEYHSSIAPGGHVLHISGPGLETLRRMNLKDLITTPYRHSHSVIRNSRGKEILSLPFVEIHKGIDNVATCRGDLARALAAALPETATIRFDVRIDSMQDHEDKQVEVELEDGEVIEGNLLIGADGNLSAVRDIYWEGEKWAEALGCWYSTYEVTMEHKLDSYVQSYSASGHIDVLTAPAKDRVAALHIWRDDHIKPPSPTEMKYDVIRRVTSKKNKTVWEVLHAAEKAANVPFLSRAFMVILDEWCRGRILLMGDAAHFLGPWSGQGAGMAMASAEALSQEMIACGNAGSTLSNALNRWEKRVRPSIERLQMRVRATAPRLLAKNTPVYAVRKLMTWALGEEAIAAWQALGVKNELELARLAPMTTVLASERRIVERQETDENAVGKGGVEAQGTEEKAAEKRILGELGTEEKGE